MLTGHRHNDLVIIVWILLAAGVVGLGAWCWRATKLRSADEIYEGLPPGMTPRDGDPGTPARIPGGSYQGEVAVAFSPPKGVRPGLVGTIVHGGPETRDVIATIVDLAARGFLKITIVESEKTRTGRDWELHRSDVPPVGPIEPNEQALLDHVFAGGSPLLLSAWPAEGIHPFSEHKSQLRVEAGDRSWYRSVTGIPPMVGLVAAAGGLAIGGFVTEDNILLALAALAAVLAMGIAALPKRRQTRTAEGTAVQIQGLAFQKYLATAEKEQFTFEEAVGIFSRYLPYAIALGVAGHWTKVFGELAADARAVGDDLYLPWLSMNGWGLYTPAMGLDSFAVEGGVDDVAGVSGTFGADAIDAQGFGFGDSGSGGGDSGFGGGFGGGDFGGGGGGGD